MNQESEFPFKRARRVTPVENQEFKAGIVEQFGIDLKKRGRPIEEEAKQRGIGYQTVINEVLLAQIG
jgi:uncharacterized protein (DUF4415 family)